MQITPLFDRVIILPQKQKQTTQSGITFTLQEQGNFIIGTVTKVSDGILEDGSKITLKVKEGDSVIFEDYSAVKIRKDEVTYYVIKQTDILAKVED